MEVMTVGREREGERARVPGFEEFLLAHGKALLRLAYVITGSRYDADDLLQDTLVDLHRSWSRVEQAAAPLRLRPSGAGESPYEQPAPALGDGTARGSRGPAAVPD